ncbi:hypothetical protein [Sphingomonas hylomeconis]|uniref:DUF2946 domain-containing protein n=1 Tax=Sphingomonas hylomeconis TaxID=1395958 RepID=A0ABV7SYU3_9SPHN|nr:hypothetical protein [Sphingomonas hylomeconis]
MIARLILVLLLACLALPAMAAAPCHDGSTGMAGMAMPHAMPAAPEEHERKAVAVHACMGCIPPATLLRAGLAAPLPRVAVPPARALVRFDRGRISPPATPPPRLDA